MRKKGFIRTLEATFAVLLLLAVVFVVLPNRSQDTTVPSRVEEAYAAVFTEVSVNESLRSCLLSLNNFGELSKLSDSCVEKTKIVTLIVRETPPGFNSVAEVCETSTTCIDNLYPDILPIDQSVFTESTFLAAESSRVLRVYFWEK